jgi:hypothetical protein
MIEQIDETKSWFFKKINNIDKSLAKLTRRKESTQINEVKEEKGNTSMDTNEI